MTESIHFYPDNRLCVKNAAKYTGYSIKTLAQLRYQGKGPRFVKPTGGRVFYYKDDLDNWMNRLGKLTSTVQASTLLHNEK